MSRLQTRFAELKQQNRAALVTFVTAGDPDYDTSLAILKGLPKAGADVIELGMPFTDPDGHGPRFNWQTSAHWRQAESAENPANGSRVPRRQQRHTAGVDAGITNPIHKFGVESFIAQAKEAGVDGLIVVDMPPSTTKNCRPGRLPVWISSA